MSKINEKTVEKELLTGDYDEYLINTLKDPKEAKAYLNAALEDEDYRVFLLALRDVADAFGISSLASISELNRENIYRMLSGKSNPKLASIVAVLRAVGVRLNVELDKKDEYPNELEIAATANEGSHKKYTKPRVAQIKTKRQSLSAYHRSPCEYAAAA